MTNKKLKTLYLHIGSHKTGTTSIQKFLLNNQDKLKENDFELFCNRPNGKVDGCGNINSWVENFGGNNVDVGIGVIKNLIGDINKNTTKNNVIISSEELSWMFNQSRINDLVESLLTIFDEIKLIVYIRRQDKHIVSHYQQVSKNLNEISVHDLYFGLGVNSLPSRENYYMEYLDYNEKIKLWETSIKKKNIIIRVFDNTEMYNGDAVCDFLNVLNLDIYVDEVIQDNESLSFCQTKVGHILRKEKVNRMIEKIVRDRLVESNYKSLPSREEARKFYADYIKSNASLNSRYNLSQNIAIFDDCFDYYPINSQDKWCEDNANEAIGSLISILDGLKFSDFLMITLYKNATLISILKKLKSYVL